MPVRCDVGKVTFICHTRMEGARHIIAEDCGRLIVVGQLALGDAFAIFISRLHDDNNTVTTNFSRISLDGDHALYFAFASCAPQAGPERAASAPAWAGLDGAFDSNVLIRSLAFNEDGQGWRFETRAGGGITADSDPVEEDAEAVAKISAIRSALAD